MHPIQMLWIGQRVPEMQGLCIESFLRRGHPVHLYTYGPVEGIPASVMTRDAEEVLSEAEVVRYDNGSPALFANLFRYKLLFEKGGWWSDSDVLCLKSWEGFPETVVATERLPSGRVVFHNGVLRSPSGSEVMKVLHEDALALKGDTHTWGKTGSRLMEFRRDLLSGAQVQPNVFCPVSWSEVTSGVVDWFRNITDATFGVHFFHEMWRRRGIVGKFCERIPAEWGGARNG